MSAWIRCRPLAAVVLVWLSTALPVAAQVDGRKDFPPELLHWKASDKNPVFTAAGPGHWDVKIRERGWILRDGDLFRMWFTGYDGTREGRKLLGYAESRDGLTWKRPHDRPLDDQHWVEDMTVVQHNGLYYMFAEGEQDVAHLLTSPDGLRWTRVGPLDIRLTDGRPIPPGPRGTPAVWHENGVWRLYYERRDLGVWLAESRDLKTWTNVSDDPVLSLGPEKYDLHAVAMNQVVKHDGRYFAVYHASDSDQPGRQWSTCLAASDDLKTWRKYPGNPILGDNKSSGLLVPVDGRLWLYTMHDRVDVHFPTTPPSKQPE